MFDIERAQAGAIAPNDDNLVVPQLVDSLDRIFQARREVPADLPVGSRPGWRWAAAGSKKMNIYPRRKLRAHRGQIQKRAGRIW